MRSGNLTDSLMGFLKLSSRSSTGTREAFTGPHHASGLCWVGSPAPAQFTRVIGSGKHHLSLHSDMPMTRSVMDVHVFVNVPDRFLCLNHWQTLPLRRRSRMIWSRAGLARASVAKHPSEM